MKCSECIAQVVCREKHGSAPCKQFNEELLKYAARRILKYDLKDKKFIKHRRPSI